jgi:hypothetical protein
VLLGAGSEAGPLRWLTRWRANMVAVDVQRPAVWQKISSLALAGNGTLQLPVRGLPSDPADDAWLDAAGADLITEAP